eukprot:TRINITY_DN9994_c0_g1_i1.p1 TRINITY_DN9994_c0_g1~~TRINITY_DN9994_c0_g1_i1.p1  ORF type:complete len:876 (+),score=328.37 TRINITY_DN9994_c0_g1_i1:265-2628(+)
MMPLQQQNGSAGTARGSAAAGPAKKLVIKPLKVKPQLPDNFEQNTWHSLLCPAVRAVHSSQPVSSSLEQLYKAAEHLADRPTAVAALYGWLEQECRQHVVGVGTRLLSECQRLATTSGIVEQQQQHTAALRLIDAEWQAHCRQMLLIRSIFLYLDRTLLMHNSQHQLRPIWEMGIELFRQHVLVPLGRRPVDAIVGLITFERDGQTIERLLVKESVRMLVALHDYQPPSPHALETALVDSADSYYERDAARCLVQQQQPGGFDVADYVRHVERRLSDESERVTALLEAQSRKALLGAVERRLLGPSQLDAIAAGLPPLLDQVRRDELGRAYVLFARVGGLDVLRRAWHEFVKSSGRRLMLSSESAAAAASGAASGAGSSSTLVATLLDWKASLTALLETSWQRNPQFRQALKEAFEAFLNERQSVPAELLAKHADELLRTGHARRTEDDAEAALDQLLELFRLVHAKDVFEAFYKKQLAKRLLLNKCASHDLERTMLQKLRLECGAGYTGKLEGMFKDMEVSRDTMAAFRDSRHCADQLADEGAAGVELNVQVLTQGFWPPWAQLELTLPPQLAACQRVFQQFYLLKHKGRRLMFQHSHGTCVLRAHFPLGKKELSVSLCQTVLLLQFNTAERLSFSDLRTATGMDVAELRRTLHSLACGKIRVLVKFGPNNVNSVDESDEFEMNKEFKQKLTRLKINAAQLKETPEEAAKTHASVQEDRQYQIDAAIVRIMKTRKSLHHQQLMSEVLGQLKFEIKAAFFKKRIESLLEREYLERAEDDETLLRYLA